MSIIDQKKKIFGSIGALNALNDKLPKLPKFNSIPSINNELNSTNFLIDLVTTLVGFNALKEHIVDTITYRLPQVEESIKNGIKSELKEIVACNINPSIPTWLQSGGSGVLMKVSDIDFFDMMKINPDTIPGSLVYSDIDGGLNSRDFNTYLYNTIQQPTISAMWGGSTTTTNILQTTFLETTNSNNNILKFNTSVEFDNKKLVEFNNTFIDSVTLFGEPNSLDSKNMINILIEELFGSLSSSLSVNKSKKQLQKEAEIREVLDCIINSENDVIDDSYFEFDNPTLGRLEEEVNNRKNGFRRLDTTENIIAKINSDDLSESQATFISVTNKEEEFNAVTTTLDNLSDIQGKASLSAVDISTVKSDFFTNLIKKLPLTIMSQIITPKFVALFAINHQIIYGEEITYDGPIDFIKKNKKLIKGLAKKVMNILLGLLLTLALKHLTAKLVDKFAGDEIEKNKSYANILLSYSGLDLDGLSDISDIINTLNT